MLIWYSLSFAHRMCPLAAHFSFVSLAMAGGIPQHGARKVSANAHGWWHGVLWADRGMFHLFLFEHLEADSSLFQVIEGLSNAIITDTRVFHIVENNFIQMYDTQSEPSTAPEHCSASEAVADYHDGASDVRAHQAAGCQGLGRRWIQPGHRRTSRSSRC